MAVFFTADTHFGHANIIEYEKRPFAGAEEMDQFMMLHWNHKVAKDDLVYHLGDFSMHKKLRTREILGELNGLKILVRGNHDYRPTAMMNLGFHACVEGAVVRIGRHKCYLTHGPPPFTIPPLWTWTLHGHVHSKWKFLPLERRICLSVENWKYAPVAEKELISFMDGVENNKEVVDEKED